MKNLEGSKRSNSGGGNRRHLAHFGFNERSKRPELGFQKVPIVDLAFGDPPTNSYFVFLSFLNLIYLDNLN